MKKYIWSAALFLTILALIIPLHGFSATVRALSLEDLTKGSAIVVRGYATTIETHRDENSRIVRRVSYHVKEYLVGDGPSAQTIRIQGGELNGIGCKVPGEVHVKIGQETILFLENTTHSDHTMRIIGLSQGRFVIQREGKTRRVYVHRPVGKLNMTGTPRRDPHNLGQNHKPVSIPLSEFKAAVRKFRGR